MFSIIIISLFVGFAWGLFCYCLGHRQAWNTWEDITAGETLSQEARDKIEGRA